MQQPYAFVITTVRLRMQALDKEESSQECGAQRNNKAGIREELIEL